MAMSHTRATLLAMCVGLWPIAAHAVDEIQVYNGEIAQPGKFTLQQHLNYAINGRKEPEFPGGLVPHHALNGTPELAYGVTNWYEVGLYAPFAINSDSQFLSNGFKVRHLFVVPNADQRNFFYGVNFEFSVNYHYWEDRHITSEVRPIVGFHLKPIDIIFNPIMDTNWTGGFGNLEFVPSTRLAYNINDKYAVAGEWYSDFGTFHQFAPAADQFHELWAVLDHTGKYLNIETGIGFGVTPGADKVTFKLMLSRDLNHPKGEAAAQLHER